MTYSDEDRLVPELRMSLEAHIDDEGDSEGDFVKLRDCEVEECGVIAATEGSSFCLWRWRGSVVWYWVKLALLFTCLGLLAAVFLKWVGPFFMDKVSFDHYFYNAFWVEIMPVCDLSSLIVLFI